ncbi:MAG: radical SAM protein [Deltaproteobacteria bacterium]|nr:radical SAM protein [Deltaproteobacteria bacterium]
MRDRPFIIPVFIPHMGCPHRCVFCDQTSITGHKDGSVSPQQVREQIAEFLSFEVRHREPVEVAFYGGNFLGLPTSYRESILDVAQGFVEDGKASGIRFSTRPDTVTGESLKSLARYTVRVVEVGAQSMDDAVLSLSRRGHTADDTKKAVAELKSCGLSTGVQIMPGLPGDTLESMLETGRSVAELNPDFVRIYPTVVVKNTILERWYRSGQFKPLALADAVEITRQLYLLFQTRGISVIRMGLQTTGSLQEPGVVVAGPFHPAFGHLVHSAVFLDRAAKALEREKTESKTVTLSVHPNDVPKLKGLKGENIRQLVLRFHLEDLHVLPDPALPQNVLRVADVS